MEIRSIENKSLRGIQVLSKIGKILSTIVFVCSIVGAAGCLIGSIATAAGLDAAIKLGGINIHNIVESEAGMTIGNMYAVMAAGFILCLGEVFLAAIAKRYFKHELEAGTPFTLAGAKEMLRLGICAIAIPMGTIIVAEFVRGIMGAFFTGVEKLEISDYTSVGVGVAFIIISVICRYGASLEKKEDAVEMKEDAIEALPEIQMIDVEE